MASSEQTQYGEWTDDPHHTTDCHYTEIQEELTHWLRGDHDGWNNWFVYTRLDHTNPPTLINFAYIHLEGSGRDVEQFVQRACQLIATGAITKNISAGGGASTTSSGLGPSTLVTEVVVAPTLPVGDLAEGGLVNDGGLGAADDYLAGTKGCTNRRENIGAGIECTCAKGFGYRSAHNCKDGNYYSCKRNGKVECFKIKAARKLGLEGGYCYGG